LHQSSVCIAIARGAEGRGEKYRCLIFSGSV
jgi:hypothetical protein